MHMSIAAGRIAGTGGTANLRKKRIEIVDKCSDATSLGAQFQQLLFEVQIKRQGTRQIKRQYGIVRGGEILNHAGQSENLGVRFYGTVGFFASRRAGFVSDQQNFAAQKSAFFIELKEFEAFAPLGDNIEAAVGIFLGNADDLRRASDFGKAFFLGPHNSENGVVDEAFTDHFFVAWLEDVQGQRRSGEQDDIEREQRKQGHGISGGRRLSFIVRQQQSIHRRDRENVEHGGKKDSIRSKVEPRLDLRSGGGYNAAWSSTAKLWQ